MTWLTPRLVRMPTCALQTSLWLSALGYDWCPSGYCDPIIMNPTPAHVPFDHGQDVVNVNALLQTLALLHLT